MSYSKVYTIRKTDTHRISTTQIESVSLLHSKFSNGMLCLPMSLCSLSIVICAIRTKATTQFEEHSSSSAHSSSISPSSLPEWTAGSSLAGGGGLLVLCRRSLRGGERSRRGGVGSLLDRFKSRLLLWLSISLSARLLRPPLETRVSSPYGNSSGTPRGSPRLR